MGAQNTDSKDAPVTVEEVRDTLKKMHRVKPSNEVTAKVLKKAGVSLKAYNRCLKWCGKGSQRLWIVDNAVAYVESGRVTLQIDKPTRHLPRAQAFHVADKIWYANQMRELQVARQRGETKTIPLTDRRRRSSLRLGGGFMLTQGTKLVLPRRTMDAPRPGQFCECAGLFEYSRDKDDDDLANDYIASLLKESQEILIARGDELYIPQLAPYPAVQVGFQPPRRLDDYNQIILHEVERELMKFAVLAPCDFPWWLDRTKWRKFWMKLLDYDQSVNLQFGYSPEISVEIAAEIETSSLECVGVLSLPDDIEKAVLAYKCGNTAKKDWNRQKEEKEIIGKGPFTYWDIEEAPPENCNLFGKKEAVSVAPPAHRQTYLIDLERCDQVGGVIKWTYNTTAKTVKPEVSSLWMELSDTCIAAEATAEEKAKEDNKGKPGGTGGRFATEKLEKAIRMHCPYPRLQPLVRL